jgi:hypothetical protein
MPKINLIRHPECPCCNTGFEDEHHNLSCSLRNQETVSFFVAEVKKTLPELTNQEDIIERIIQSASLKTNHTDEKWNLEVQNDIKWNLLLKAMVRQTGRQ